MTTPPPPHCVVLFGFVEFIGYESLLESCWFEFCFALTCLAPDSFIWVYLFYFIRFFKTFFLLKKISFFVVKLTLFFPSPFRLPAPPPPPPPSWLFCRIISSTWVSWGCSGQLVSSSCCGRVKPSASCSGPSFSLSRFVSNYNTNTHRHTLVCLQVHVTLVCVCVSLLRRCLMSASSSPCCFSSTPSLGCRWVRGSTWSWYNASGRH